MAKKSMSHAEFRDLLSKHPGRWPEYEKEWGTDSSDNKPPRKVSPPKAEAPEPTPQPKEKPRLKPFGSFFKGLLGHKR